MWLLCGYRYKGELRSVAKQRHRSLLRLQFDMKKKRKHSWTNPKTQMAIIADRSTEMSYTVIAEKYRVDKATVSRVCKKFRQEVPQAEMSIDLENWKQQLKAKTIAAIDAALDSAFDPYKRASVGIAVLKGVGEFAQENAIQVNHFDINNIPVELRDRYLSTPEDETVVKPVVYFDGQVVKDDEEIKLPQYQHEQDPSQPKPIAQPLNTQKR